MLLGVYFGLLLVPNWWPGFAGNAVFFVFVLSLPFFLFSLIGVGVWGIAGAIVALRRGSVISKRHRTLVVVSVAALVMFGCTMVLSRAIRGELPTGSHLLEFAPEAWREPSASEFAADDITVRQKMLGSLVTRFSAAQDRAALEALLGPSLETQYFESTGRDLIYILGPERDSLFGIDSEWLLIWLDNSGHFERYEIRRD